MVVQETWTLHADVQCATINWETFRDCQHAQVPELSFLFSRELCGISKEMSRENSLQYSGRYLHTASWVYCIVL